MLLLLIPGRARRISVIVVVAWLIVIAGHSNVVYCYAVQIQSPTQQQIAQTATPQVSPLPAPPDTDGWHKTIDSVQKLIAALAIIVGGFWAWLKFFRGRTFRSRLELKVSAKVTVSGTNKFLQATMQMKNVGLSQVTLKKDALYLDVFLSDAAKVEPAQQIYSARWNEPATFAVFQEHGWIEPAEEIDDQLLFQMPEGEQLACKLKLTVNSDANSWVFFETEGTRWSAIAIIDCLPPLKADESAIDKKGKDA